MNHCFAAVLISAAFFAASALPSPAQDASTRPLRSLFGPPVQTLKQVIQGERKLGESSPVERQPETKAPEPEASVPADDRPIAGPANVPSPRPRPEVAATGAATPTNEVQPAVAAASPVVADEPVRSGKPPEPPVVAKASRPAADTASVPTAGAAAVDIPSPRLRSAAKPPVRSAKLTELPPNSGDRQSGSCRRNLRSLGITSVSVAPIHKGNCGIAAPIKVSSLDHGSIALTTDATLTCRTANALATWMTESVEPAAEQYLKSRVTGIRVAASYHCRTRNGVPGAKLSEHAKGNAIDISAVRVEGVGWIEVGKSKGMAANRFMRAIRKSACGPFTTVLGPGSDRYHSDHFHLDVATRGKNGRSLYCK